MVILICIIIGGVLKKMSQSVECSGEKHMKYICDKELFVQKQEKKDFPGHFQVLQPAELGAAHNSC